MKNIQMKHVLESVDLGILLTIPDGTIVLCNQRFREMVKKPVREGVTRLFSLFDESLFDFFSRDSFDFEPARFGVCEMTVRKSRLSYDSSAYQDLYFFRDITYVKSLEEKISRQAKTQGFTARSQIQDILYQSDSMRRCLESVRIFSPGNKTILLEGESGTGKELIAQSIHRLSDRSLQPFVAVNCAAVPENLLESELFGYEEGAFTGAKKGGRPGLFEFAHHGTLFLDEVEGMSLSMQVKLLRVLQEGEIMRVGGGSIIRVDVRIVAATNEALEKKIQEGSFRKDLYYRLNALTVEIPPLRKRGDDIFMLFDFFMRKMGGNFTLSEEVKAFLRRHPWPGNIRELQNAVEYFNYLAKPVIELSDLPPTMTRVVGVGLDVVGPGESSGENENVKTGTTQLKEGSTYSGHMDTEAKKQFVLKQLALAWKAGETVGREKILEAAKKDHIPMTQKQARDLLKELEKEGLLQVGRGRGGSRITEKGLKKLEKQK